MSIHTIFIPKGCSVEQVWECIKRGEKVIVKGGTAKAQGVWVNVDENGKVVR